MHDDVIKWKHFPRYWPFVWGIYRSLVNSPHKGQWRGALKFSLICIWINGWVNNYEAGDLRCYHAHYDVIVMVSEIFENEENYNELWSSLCTDGLSPSGSRICPQTSAGTVITIFGSYTHTHTHIYICIYMYPDSEVHGANMGPIWGQQDPGGPHVGSMNLAIWVCMCVYIYIYMLKMTSTWSDHIWILMA